ncbi:jg25681 [Pararge aegeria aegeria]|uniref:Jg25681 protein n=1 Tax=Pararge aegeria aegeria TaxID=348720 RepID=A0A8S4SBR6_9NEOP|nr:jg25681 [Pararge aegeria aegeria]
MHRQTVTNEKNYSFGISRFLLMSSSVRWGQLRLYPAKFVVGFFLDQGAFGTLVALTRPRGRAAYRSVRVRHRRCSHETPPHKAQRTTSKMATGPKIVHKQFNSPMGLYSQQNIQETLNKHMQNLDNGTVGFVKHYFISA